MSQARNMIVFTNLDRYLFDPSPKSVQDDFRNLLGNLESLNTKHKSPNTIGWEICRHLEGILIGPILVSLGMSEYLLENIEDNREINDEIIDNKLPVLKSVMDFFITLGWLKYDNNNYYFTDEGLFFIKRSSAYGVTVSYLPTFQHIPELLFNMSGNSHFATIIPKIGIIFRHLRICVPYKNRRKICMMIKFTKLCH